MNECPFKNCICVPICQSKHWYKLIKDCMLISKFFRVHERDLTSSNFKDVTIEPLNQHYRLSKSSNGTISYGLRRSKANPISTLCGIVDADQNIGVW